MRATADDESGVQTATPERAAAGPAPDVRLASRSRSLRLVAALAARWTTTGLGMGIVVADLMYFVLTWSSGAHRAVLLSLSLVAAVGLLASVTQVQHRSERLPFAERLDPFGLFVAVLVTVSCLLDGGASSPLVWLFPMFIAFSAAVGSRRAVTGQASSCVAGYAVVALFGQDAPALAGLGLHTLYLVLAAVFAVRLTSNRLEAEERQQALTDELARLAEHDGLTGLANHRSFHQRLAAALDHARRCGDPVGLLLVDVDRFKAVNDGYGHLVGDLALQETARQLVAQARPGDVAGRVGGEEFALLLPGLDGDAAWLVAEQLRRAVEQGAGPVPLTVSVGVCAFPAQAGSAEELIGGADAAMYRAKQSGRNRVCCSA